MAKGRRRVGGKNAYRFTAKRKTALKRAQTISARKRKGKGKYAKIIAGTAVAGGIGAVIVAKKRSDWRKSVDPNRKEGVRIAESVSPAWASVPRTPRPNAAPPVKPGDPEVEKELLRGLAEEGRRAAEVEKNRLGKGMRVNRPLWGNQSAMDPNVANEEIEKRTIRDADGVIIEEDADLYGEWVDSTLPKGLRPNSGNSGKMGKTAAKREIRRYIENRNKLLRGDNVGANSEKTLLDAMETMGEFKSRSRRRRKRKSAKVQQPKKKDGS